MSREVRLVYNSKVLQDRMALAYAKSLKNHVVKEWDLTYEKLTPLQIKELAEKLGTTPGELMINDAPVDADAMDSQDTLTYLSQNPDLIKTPVAVYASHAEFASPYALIKQEMDGKKGKTTKNSTLYSLAKSMHYLHYFYYDAASAIHNQSLTDRLKDRSFQLRVFLDDLIDLLDRSKAEYKTLNLQEIINLRLEKIKLGTQDALNYRNEKWILLDCLQKEVDLIQEYAYVYNNNELHHDVREQLNYQRTQTSIWYIELERVTEEYDFGKDEFKWLENGR